MAVLEFSLYFVQEHHPQATAWQQRLAELNVHITLCAVEQLNARFLRQHPNLALLVDEDGLWLSANGMKMQPAWQDELHRLKRAGIKNELIARACQIGKVESVLDATAGLGHDGLILAWLGAKVTLLERHPILFALLESTLQQARQHPILSTVAERIKLQNIDAADYLTQMNQHQFDVIYLDPMFPQRDANQRQEKKHAQVKKQMQLLHLLLPDDGVMDLGEVLLGLARQKADRVIVKRPKHAVFLDGQSPEHQWIGDACRFDGYFNHITQLKLVT